MRRNKSTTSCPAALAVEAAVILPVFVLLLLAIVIGGMGIFSYQQTANLAREATRYACVHGADSQKYTNQTSATAQQILQQAVLPRAAGINVSALVGAVTDWDSASKNVLSLNSTGEYVTNSVRVTATYLWTPGWFFGGIRLQSVAELPMSF
jgi:Flp pilus assembly protein TadG